MSDYIDISMPIYDGMAHWPTDPPVTIQTFKSPEKGNRSVVSMLQFGSHTGTHVDAPKHFLAGGSGVDAMLLERLIGPCYLVDARGMAEITERALADIPDGPVARVLFRTDNSARLKEGVFFKDFVALAPRTAEALVEREVVLVGVDGFSVDPFNAPKPAAHLALLGAGVVIIEGLCLHDVLAGAYDLTCLPLRFRDGDGAPARVVLRRRI